MPSIDPDSRLVRIEEQQLFMERQIEELSGELHRLAALVDRLKRDLEAERARVAQLNERLTQDRDVQEQ